MVGDIDVKYSTKETHLLKGFFANSSSVRITLNVVSPETPFNVGITTNGYFYSAELMRAN